MTDDYVRLTDHAADRWAARSDDTGYGPVVAWREGRVIPEPHGLEADEVRFHRPSGTVLLNRDGYLVTVIDADSAKPKLRRALRCLGDVADLEIEGGERR
ncbi:hypothetical protein [Haloplanus sp. C73]|uniref:hypothetical protein n=1 Tax=Haloplanus sp. C73 TaxID=3421641 RepID=UPI003EB9301E